MCECSLSETAEGRSSRYKMGTVEDEKRGWRAAACGLAAGLTGTMPRPAA